MVITIHISSFAAERIASMSEKFRDVGRCACKSASGLDGVLAALRLDYGDDAEAVLALSILAWKKFQHDDADTFKQHLAELLVE